MKLGRLGFTGSNESDRTKSLGIYRPEANLKIKNTSTDLENITYTGKQYLPFGASTTYNDHITECTISPDGKKLFILTNGTSLDSNGISTGSKIIHQIELGSTDDVSSGSITKTYTFNNSDFAVGGVTPTNPQVYSIKFKPDGSLFYVLTRHYVAGPNNPDSVAQGTVISFGAVYEFSCNTFDLTNVSLNTAQYTNSIAYTELRNLPSSTPDANPIAQTYTIPNGDILGGEKGLELDPDGVFFLVISDGDIDCNDREFYGQIIDDYGQVIERNTTSGYSAEARDSIQKYFFAVPWYISDGVSSTVSIDLNITVPGETYPSINNRVRLDDQQYPQYIYVLHNKVKVNVNASGPDIAYQYSNFPYDYGDTQYHNDEYGSTIYQYKLRVAGDILSGIDPSYTTKSKYFDLNHNQGYSILDFYWNKSGTTLHAITYATQPYFEYENFSSTEYSSSSSQIHVTFDSTITTQSKVAKIHEKGNAMMTFSASTAWDISSISIPNHSIEGIDYDIVWRAIKHGDINSNEMEYMFFTGSDSPDDDNNITGIQAKGSLATYLKKSSIGYDSNATGEFGYYHVGEQYRAFSGGVESWFFGSPNMEFGKSLLSFQYSTSINSSISPYTQLFRFIPDQANTIERYQLGPDYAGIGTYSSVTRTQTYRLPSAIQSSNTTELADADNNEEFDACMIKHDGGSLSFFRPESDSSTDVIGYELISNNSNDLFDFSSSVHTSTTKTYIKSVQISTNANEVDVDDWFITSFSSGTNYAFSLKGGSSSCVITKYTMSGTDPTSGLTYDSQNTFSIPYAKSFTFDEFGLYCYIFAGGPEDYYSQAENSTTSFVNSIVYGYYTVTAWSVTSSWSTIGSLNVGQQISNANSSYTSYFKSSSSSTSYISRPTYQRPGGIAVCPSSGTPTNTSEYLTVMVSTLNLYTLGTQSIVFLVQFRNEQTPGNWNLSNYSIETIITTSDHPALQSESFTSFPPINLKYSKDGQYLYILWCKRWLSTSYSRYLLTRYTLSNPHILSGSDSRAIGQGSVSCSNTYHILDLNKNTAVRYKNNSFTQQEYDNPDSSSPFFLDSQYKTFNVSTSLGRIDSFALLSDGSKFFFFVTEKIPSTTSGTSTSIVVATEPKTTSYCLVEGLNFLDTYGNSVTSSGGVNFGSIGIVAATFWRNDTEFYLLTTPSDTSTQFYLRKYTRKSNAPTGSYKLIDYQHNSISPVISLSAGETIARIRDFKFDSNGTKVFILSSQTGRIYSYTLSSGWDVTTLNTSSKVTSQKLHILAPLDPTPNSIPFLGGLLFDPSGDNFYVFNDNSLWRYYLFSRSPHHNDRGLVRYPLSSSFDFSSSSFPGITLLTSTLISSSSSSLDNNTHPHSKVHSNFQNNGNHIYALINNNHDPRSVIWNRPEFRLVQYQVGSNTDLNSSYDHYTMDLEERLRTYLLENYVGSYLNHGFLGSINIDDLTVTNSDPNTGKCMLLALVRTVSKYNNSSVTIHESSYIMSIKCDFETNSGFGAVDNVTVFCLNEIFPEYTKTKHQYNFIRAIDSTSSYLINNVVIMNSFHAIQLAVPIEYISDSGFVYKIPKFHQINLNTCNISDIHDIILSDYGNAAIQKPISLSPNAKTSQIKFRNSASETIRFPSHIVSISGEKDMGIFIVRSGTDQIIQRSSEEFGRFRNSSNINPYDDNVSAIYSVKNYHRNLDKLLYLGNDLDISSDSNSGNLDKALMGICATVNDGILRVYTMDDTGTITQFDIPQS